MTLLLKGNNKLKKFLYDERGAEMAEYILIISLIAIYCIYAVKMFGGKVSDAFQRAAQIIEKETK